MLELNENFLFRDQKIAWGSLGQGQPIILVHGFPWSSQVWRNIAPILARDKKVFYFDMLGTGRSEMHNDQIVSEDVQSDLLAALISHWSLEKPAIVGHDFGGLATLRAHFINGVEYSKAYLFNCVALLPSGSPFYAHVAHHEAAFAGLPEYAHEALLNAYIQTAAHYPLRDEAKNIYMKPWMTPHGQKAFYRQIAQADTNNINEVQKLYQTTPFEIHMAWGEKDSFIPLSRGRKLQDKLSAKSFTPIPNASHIVQEDAPEALIGFLLAN